MRFRGTTIRRKIVALLLIPLVSLTAIWAFSAMLTGRQVWGLFGIERIVDNLGYPAEDTVGAVQQERREAMVYLADPHHTDAKADYRATQRATDRRLDTLSSNARANRAHLSDDSISSLDTAIGDLENLSKLRAKVEDGTISRDAAFNAYNAAIDPCYTFLDTLNPLDNVSVDEQGRALIMVMRAREDISREDALLAPVLHGGRLSAADDRAFAFAVAQERTYYTDNIPLLGSGERALVSAYWKSPDGQALRSAEDAVLDAGPDGAAAAARGADWQATATRSLATLHTIDHKSIDLHKKQAGPIATRLILEAALVGGLGLIAVIASIVVSVRIGRALVRDLTGLRKEAQEVSGSRLPRVMRRLAAGEEVDVETEAPRLDYPDDEIGQVGKALNTLQRAAVEAAVRQADMRRGVSEVFVNLARRSQVLLHRQLTLLDRMERRTEDSRELADLFRLDHMTTRMRRHAEGLVILSGAVPSRQWRKPVQLMDVVRAAVAEVEDYERIEVRRLPRLAVTGSAVADLTHLVAELVENATVFSPPHTTVQVHGEPVANGFALEIDDRGLGLTPDAMLEANLRLAETPEFELSDTDRLGLFVVSRLAQRQGVRVSLRPSPFGGTTAVVMIPARLLSENPDSLEGPENSVDLENTGEFGPGGAQGPGDPALAGPGGPGGYELVEPGRHAAPAVAGAPGGTFGDEHGFRQWGLGAEAPREHNPFAAQDAPAAPGGTGDPDDAPALPRRRRRTPVLVADHGRPVGPGPEREPERTPDPQAIADPATGRPYPFGRPPAGPAQPGAQPSAEPRADAQDRTYGGLPGQGLPVGGSTPPGTGGLPVRGGGAPGGPAVPGPRSAPLPPAPPTAYAPQPPVAPPVGTGPVAPAPARPPIGPGGLPRRVRQASLAPQLREADTTAQTTRRAAPGADAGRERTPDEIRARMASLQRGWQRGRRNPADDTDDGARSASPGEPAPGTTTEGNGP
jgi:signal transduction histidine kinase